eukprot:1098595-Pleurochrysis_carterae.AAC.9
MRGGGGDRRLLSDASEDQQVIARPQILFAYFTGSLSHRGLRLHFCVDAMLSSSRRCGRCGSSANGWRCTGRWRCACEGRAGAGTRGGRGGDGLRSIRLSASFFNLALVLVCLLTSFFYRKQMGYINILSRTAVVLCERSTAARCYINCCAFKRADESRRQRAALTQPRRDGLKVTWCF